MADLAELDRAEAVKVAGASNITGIADNYMDVDTNGNAHVIATSAGPVAPGTVASNSNLIGGQFNTALPTLTNTQQSAIQLDSSGRIIIAPITQGILAEDHNYGTVGANTLRTASQIGNATGVADFAAGNSSAQTLRVVVASNQVAIPVTGTFWQTTQPISAASLPLPTGAATEATLVKLPLAQASTTSGQSGVLAQGAVTTAAPTYVTGQTDPLSLTTAGALRVDGSGVTQPVSGTVTANQGGTWNINNISGTISLPTGASTSALQTTGNTSLATIATNTANLTVAQASTTSGQTGQLVQGAVTTNPPAYTTGQTDPFSLTRNGDLRAADIVNDIGQYRAQSVTTTAAEALGAATILADRKSLTITPTNGIVYWGYSNAVTTTTGTPIFKNQCMSFAVGANVHVWVISAGTVDCRISEGS